MDKLFQNLKKYKPASVKLACFSFKKEAFKKDFRIDYLGITIPNEFVVGYGLDYDGYGRNLSGHLQDGKMKNEEINKKVTKSQETKKQI